MWRVLAANPQLQVWQSQANFLYLRLKNIKSDNTTQKYTRLINDLKARGTSIRYTGGGLRVTIGTPSENNNAIARLQELVN